MFLWTPTIPKLGSPLEDQVARIWAEVLSLGQVGIHDNFLELGGHSLAATQVISRIIEKLNLELPLRLLFDAPTVADMAETITQHQKSPAKV
jgi:acyl carrier protein